MKPGEQLTILILRTADNGSTSPGFVSTQRESRLMASLNRFWTKIGAKRTLATGDINVRFRHYRASGRAVLSTKEERNEVAPGLGDCMNPRAGVVVRNDPERRIETA
jgi:hypothetical protein